MTQSKSDAEIVAMYPEKTIGAIAEELSISRYRVTSVLRSNGVQIRHGGRRERTAAEHAGKGSTLTSAEHDLIVEVGRSGGTLREIATRVRECGLPVSGTAVLIHLRIAGITPTPGKRGGVAKPNPIATAPTQHSPSVAHWIATCRSCKVRIGAAEARLGALAKRLSRRNSLTDRQKSTLAEARTELATAKEISAVCSDCNRKAVAE